MSNRNLRCVIYARYSCSQQTEQSIEGQLHDCEKYAALNGLSIIKNYIDRAISGRTDSRPQFQQMISDSKKHMFDVVLVWKLDRFSRDRYDSAVYKRELKKNGVRVMSAMEGLNDSPESILLESMLEGYAEYFSRDLSQKVKRGLRETAKKHKVTGLVPFGYVKSHEGKYEIDPRSAAAVQTIFEMYLSGARKRDIAEYLNNLGFQTAYGNKFTKEAITPLLTKTRYIGKYTYADIEIVDETQRIVSDELFYNVQRKIMSNVRPGAMRKASEHYLLTKKIYCGDCGQSMHGESCKARNQTIHNYYTCSGRKKLKICNSKRVKRDKLEDFIIQQIQAMLCNTALINRIADAVIELQKMLNENNQVLRALNAQLSDVESKIKNIVSAVERGMINQTMYERLSELEEIKNKLIFEIESKKSSIGTFNKADILNFFKCLSLRDNATWQEKEAIIELAINRIYVWNDGRIFIMFNYANASDNKTSDAEFDINDIIKKIDEPYFNGSPINDIGSSSWARTSDIMINSHALCQLSYRGI